MRGDLMKNKLFPILAIFLSFTLCQAPAQSDAPSAETIETLNKLQDLMEQATLKGDYVTIAEHYTVDAVIMPDFAPAIRGRKALLAAYKNQQKEGTKFHSFSTTAELRWQKENEIFERGTFGMSVTGRKSPKPTAYYGSYFQIWQKEPDGRYLMKFTIWNLDFNPFGP